MSALLSIVAGWTGVLGPFVLKVDGAALDLTQFTVTLELHDSLGATVTPGGTVTVDPDQTTNRGQVSYSPIALDFTFSSNGNTFMQSYRARWKVVDGNGKIVYFPNGAPDEINVYKA